MIIGEIQATVIRSKRKTISIQIKPDCEITIRAPIDMSDGEISAFVTSKSDWIKKTIERFEKTKTQAQNIEPLTFEQIKELADKALRELPPRVAEFALKIGVKCNGITVRNQKTRWGSCSAKGNINLNCLIMLMPEDVQDYIIVHELCHLKEMNHSKRFWGEVENAIPEYKEKEKWLKENGSTIMRRMCSK